MENKSEDVNEDNINDNAESTVPQNTPQNTSEKVPANVVDPRSRWRNIKIGPENIKTIPITVNVNGSKDIRDWISEYLRRSLIGDFPLNDYNYVISINIVEVNPVSRPVIEDINSASGKAAAQGDDNRDGPSDVNDVYIFGYAYNSAV